MKHIKHLLFKEWKTPKHTTHSKNMSKLSSLRLLESYLEDLFSLIEESNRLQDLGESSEDSDYELRKNLVKINRFLERNDDGEDFDELVQQYEDSLNDIKTLDTAEFLYKRHIVPKAPQPKKSVRFNELVETNEDVPTFQPYRDDVIEPPSEETSNELFDGANDDDDSQSIDSASNHELFIHHQQQLVQQDQHLDSLSQSVRRQHELSVDIHGELQDQNIMLDDLENQLESSQKNVSRGHRRLEYFSKKAKENGQWLTIVVLIIILVLLLVILK